MNVKQCSMTRAMLRQVITFAKEAEKLNRKREEDSAFYF